MNFNMKTLSFLLILFALKSFGQSNRDQTLKVIDSLCNTYIPKAPLCTAFAYGRSLSAIETNLAYIQKDNKIDVNCTDDRTIDKQAILKIAFNSDVVEGKKSRHSELEIYYNDGQPFYVKIKTKSSRWFRKDREYEFSYVNNEFPKHIDSSTRKLLASHFKELH